MKLISLASISMTLSGSVLALPMMELNESQQVETRELNVVSGKIPSWLNGNYIYNGPAKYRLKKQTIGHWLDGLAMLYKFNFSNGRVKFSNKFLRSNVYLDAIKEGKLTQAFIQKDISLKSSSNPYYTTNANINTAFINNRFAALGETLYAVEFDLQTLDTVGPFLFDNDDPNQAAQVHELAHMKKDPSTGDYYTLRTSFGFFSHYHLYRIKAGTQKRQEISKISISRPSYMHDISISENFIILIASPLQVNPWDLKNTNKGYINYFSFKKNKLTRIYLINKHTGQTILEGECPQLFTFHHINAYEIKDKVIVDFIAYESPDVIYDLDNNALNSSYLAQISIDTKNQTVNLNSRTLVNSPNIDLPRINEYKTGQNYQYFYGVTFKDFSHKRGLVKVNLINTELKLWEMPFHYAGEGLFISSPDAKAEDEGVILSIVYNEKENQSFLLILNAKTMNELARAILPFPIPLGLHGNYLPD